MIFGKINTVDARECILAHSLKTSTCRIRKGTWLTQANIDSLLLDNINKVTVARLEDGDVHENEAATQLGLALSGTGVATGKASTGRVNCYAQTAGLLTIPKHRILACNQISESITASTLPENRWVEAGKMVATIKIIPYAVDKTQLELAIAAKACHIDELESQTLASEGVASTIRVHKALPRSAHLVQTTQPGTSASLLKKTEQVTARRLLLRSVCLSSSTSCSHDIDKLSQRLKKIVDSAVDRFGDNKPTTDTTAQWILISGASAISDSRDVIPEAIRQAGGTVTRFGIPVDPGNLLLLGDIKGFVVIGIPGCARSHKHNGLDLFLDRLACNLPITTQWINSLAVGGLMGEIIDLPLPRSRRVLPTTQQALGTGSHVQTQANHNPSNQDPSIRDPMQDTHNEAGPISVSGLLLAAGMSRRFGTENKLLADVYSAPMILHALDNLIIAGAQHVLIITGHDHETIVSLCSNHIRTRCNENVIDIQFVHNPDYASGMASSLKTGISHLIQSHSGTPTNASQGALICLADMPQVKPDSYRSLIDAAMQSITTEGHDMDIQRPCAFVPTYKGTRGNPVLLMSELFDPLLDIEGDVGARHLLQANPESVQEVAVSDAGILKDYDTPEQLQNTH